MDDIAKLVDVVRVCQAFNALPQAGGVLDQDCFLVEGTKLVLAVDDERQKRELDKAKAKAKGASKHA